MKLLSLLELSFFFSGEVSDSKGQALAFSWGTGRLPDRLVVQGV